MRVGTEMVSLSGLKQQVKCYLATLNSLRLVNPDYAWIVKPVLKVIDYQQPNVPPGVSPKHTYDGDVVTPAKVRLFSRILCSRIQSGQKSTTFLVF